MKLKSTKMSDSKQVRVDNWGSFFLQRLQMFFSKTDYCDMTLQFSGNVQLKVHRLVMNACTDYFQLLEQTCTVEDGVILMPNDLQADVIVPIVNFMYTGMLEFQLTIFDKLYKAAELMNITILTKLLDAQRQGVNNRQVKKKNDSSQSSISGKRANAKSDLPSTLPGRKLPIWKRKHLPSSSQQYSSSSSYYSDNKWTSNTPDPLLSVTDNTPKPTRFEWPEEELPTLNLLDSNFENISYTSKPLLTQEDEIRASTSFDDNNKSIQNKTKKHITTTLDMDEMKNYIKEQKIRSGLSNYNSDNDNDIDYVPNGQGQKRKIDLKKSLISSGKKTKFNDNDSKKTMISIEAQGKNVSELDHNKIVSEILKKYPHLVKKNKNIKLKIMTKNKANAEAEKQGLKSLNIKIQTQRSSNDDKIDDEQQLLLNETDQTLYKDNKAPWVCHLCSTDDSPMEFALYYLFRKHMSEIHNEKFDQKLCKYCGAKCLKHNLLAYHLYIKHDIKPPSTYKFPKCNKCPFIALSTTILYRHKLRHNKNEIQCLQCKLTFTTATKINKHYNISGHNKDINQNIYNCQYCNKIYKTEIYLFRHIKIKHYNDAINDGIVGIDENDEYEEYQPEGELKDEYILPDIIDENLQQTKNKVNILSNIKVTNREQLPSTSMDTTETTTTTETIETTGETIEQQQQQITLEPSSEAEALSNVASGIATSLGLVDIVVLNDDQQLFLQSNQTNYNQNDNNNHDNHDNHQYILPELNDNDNNYQQNQIIHQHQTTTIINSNDIGSTDELVMVLTDHDYGDNQDDINNDNNSNIVVLYSHPVDGQQNQFITTTNANIMLNSQTGIIEIRNNNNNDNNNDNNNSNNNNNQLNVNDDSQIESIEMIQREIHGHANQIKQEQQQQQQQDEQLDQQQQQQQEQELQMNATTSTPSVDTEQQATAELDENERIQLERFCAEHVIGNEQITNNDESQLTEEQKIENISMDTNEQTFQQDNENIQNESKIIEENINEKENLIQSKQENDEKIITETSDSQNDELNESNQDQIDQNILETTEQQQQQNDQEIEESQLEEEEEEEEEIEKKDDENNKVKHERDDDVNFENKNNKIPLNKNEKETIDKKSSNKSNKSSKSSILDDWEDTDSQQSDNKEEKKEAVNNIVDEWEDDDEDDKKE